MNEVPISYELTPAERASLINLLTERSRAESRVEGALLLLANTHGLVGQVEVAPDLMSIRVKGSTV